MDFLERTREEEENRNKIYFVILLAVTILLGVVIFGQYVAFTESELTLSEQICESALADSYKMNADPKTLEEFMAYLANSKNSSVDKFKFIKFNIGSECNNKVGYWISNSVAKKYYLYCSENKVVSEFDVRRCGSTNITEAMDRAYNDLVNFLTQKSS